ncbi:hypothetical protein AN958_06249 [Leucoagaricus sp. SymC.cos]|nr:hypothetical protein AN958_06249 [Leucoagaricus sp. SymC.cos]
MTTALINSGSQGNFINNNLIDKLRLVRKKLKTPILLQFADGTINKESSVKQYVNIEMTIDNKTVKQLLYITNLNNQQIILGTPFLESTNLDIDWRKRTFKWREEKILPKLLHSTN